MPPLKPSELFKKLLEASGSHKKEFVPDYNTFQDSVPDILTLDEFVNLIYKKVVEDNSKPHRYFSERYIRDEYLSTDICATNDYVLEFTNKMLLLQQRIDLKKHKHLSEFIVLVVNHLNNKRVVLSKQCLEFLNKIYKTKGDFGNTYK
tara:strand:+ start:90 stop:533 length:444 start_codon:yes stop_codon:yes gene_type:complete